MKDDASYPTRSPSTKWLLVTLIVCVVLAALVFLLRSRPMLLLSVVGGPFAVLILTARSLVFTSGPEEALVLTGRRYRQPDGADLSYHVVRSGRCIRIPIVERVHRIDLSVISIVGHVEGAYSREGIPLNVKYHAAVRISSDPKIIGDAVERFLGRERGQIEVVAREIIEGSLRDLISALSPEEASREREAVLQCLKVDLHEEFGRLGLQLERLRVGEVSDTYGYLASLGEAAAEE